MFGERAGRLEAEGKEDGESAKMPGASEVAPFSGRESRRTRMDGIDQQEATELF